MKRLARRRMFEFSAPVRPRSGVTTISSTLLDLSLLQQRELRQLLGVELQGGQVAT